MGKLDGKVAIVTGAARGLGRAYARRLAGLGAKIAVADLNLKSYEEFDAEAKDMTADSTVAEIEAAGGAALGFELDVCDADVVQAMVDSVVATWGRVDVLVANAGGGRGRPLDTKATTLDPALLQLVIGMNLYGTVYSCNAVGPVMKAQKSGKIITVSSIAGRAASPDGGYAHYGAAKAAIARDRGKTCHTAWARAVFPGRSGRGTRPLIDWRARFARGDQALIAAISGPTPRIVIIRLML
jgi:3-oxoacyl-[acyl-carrier protein] reductase